MTTFGPRFALVPFLVLLAACAGGRPPTDTAATTGDPPSGAGVAARSETVVADMITAVPPDAYQLLALAVRNDSLVATVQYGGGCRTHELRLVLVRGFLESQPVQLRALLDHRADGDPCKALVAQDVAFDLRPLRELYRQSYPAGPGVVRLNLLPPASQSVEYRF